MMPHVLIALVIQAVVAQFAGIWVGAALAAGYFIGREFAQAEYRVIEAHYKHRIDMPLWGGFEPRAWTAKALIDWIAPAVAVCVVAWWM
jgi:hypothetical protein